jgi:hypothetical protein
MIKTPRGIKYYPVQRNWTKKIEPHLLDDDVVEVLVTEFNKYTLGRWGMEFVDGVPFDWEDGLWCAHRGRIPRFWRYVKQSACHWLVNFELELAMRAEPKRPWRIITSDHHSSVWDGRIDLFDPLFLALGYSARYCFELANGKHLLPGEHLETFLCAKAEL